VILTTTPSVEGRRIAEYGAIVGANVIRDLMASVRDFFGGRSGAYEAELKKAREIALKELAEEARRKGADAVVGIDPDYEVVGQSMLMVTASGTAVRLE